MTPKKFKINKVDTYLIISIILMIVYTIASLIILVSTGCTYDQLTICFFAAFGTEIASCCIIKSLNIKNEKLDPEPQDSKGECVG